MECQREKNGKWFLEGVASYIGFDRYTKTVRVTMFTITEMFSEWIKQAIELLEKSGKNFKISLVSGNILNENVLLVETGNAHYNDEIIEIPYPLQQE